ncbi:phosphatase PAP2 family protein [Longimicrobium sp.]|uniref:phosphatase PAP2 family protein n=1 Tax=Longimicrobium sp. TaxID=2029185 RepID=UPI002E31A8A1|nr:phosphatase PAP2 family protein [Longimicrobium sp.]HEX6041500.1 phosphatase PAP2 family protein [Longimicrobium sp.]
MRYTDERENDDAPRGRDRAGRVLALGLVATTCAAGLVRLARAAARRETAALDEAVRERTAAPEDHPARDAAEAAAPIGKWYTYLPAALAASAYLLAAHRPEPGPERRSRVAGVGAVMLTGAAATALNPAFDDWLPQPPAPPGHESRRKPVFPSGHAFGPGAVALATAYVAAREGLAHPAAAFPVALLVPAVTAGGRVLQEKHWASDVLGGYLGGIALAAASAAAYEAIRNG